MASLDIDKIIQEDFCVGCGVCAGSKESPYKIVTTAQGRFKAQLTGENNTDHLKKEADELCPFSSSSYNEDYLARVRFSDIEKINKDEELGYYLSMYAGHVNEGQYREKGSSGGGVSWLLKELMQKDLIDAVIHVKEGDSKESLFEFAISESVEEMRKGAKSRYYPVELSEVLKVVRNSTKRFAIVGIPCFIKATRNLAEKDELIRDRIVFFIGIVCGSLKSKNFASLFAWQHGIHPDELKKIDFRHKIPSPSAALYSVKMEYRKKEGAEVHTKISKPASELYGTDWGMNFFKYKACDYCDDVMAETADVVFGDAWADEFRVDWKGSNLILSRNLKIDEIINEGLKREELSLKRINKDTVIRSQSGSFRHRRKGLSYRLSRLQKKGLWHPTKRINAGQFKVEERFVKVQEFRIWFFEHVDDLFAEALSKNSFTLFKKRLFIPILKYKYLVYGLRGITPNFMKDLYRVLFKQIK